CDARRCVERRIAALAGMKLQRSSAYCPVQTLEPPSVRAEVSKLSLGPCRRFDAKTKSAIASVFSVSLCPLCLDATSHQRADLPCSAPSQGFFEHRGHRDTEDTENTMRSQEDNATGVSGLGRDTGASAMGRKLNVACVSPEPLVAKYLCSSDAPPPRQLGE